MVDMTRRGRDVKDRTVVATAVKTNIVKEIRQFQSTERIIKYVSSDLTSKRKVLRWDEKTLWEPPEHCTVFNTLKGGRSVTPRFWSFVSSIRARSKTLDDLRQ